MRKTGPSRHRKGRAHQAARDKSAFLGQKLSVDTTHILPCSHFAPLTVLLTGPLPAAGALAAAPARRRP